MIIFQKNLLRWSIFCSIKKISHYLIWTFVAADSAYSFCSAQLRSDIKFFCSSFLFTPLTSDIVSTLRATFFIQISLPVESFLGSCIVKTLIHLFPLVWIFFKCFKIIIIIIRWRKYYRLSYFYVFALSCCLFFLIIKHYL